MLIKIRFCLIHWNAQKILILLVTLGIILLSIFLIFLDIPLSSSAVMKQSAFKSKLSKILKEKYLNEWKSVYAGDLPVSGRKDPDSKTNKNTDTHCIDKIRNRTDVALNWYADMFLYRYRVREPITDMYMYLYRHRVREPI